jgi:hypothetical protein
MRFVGLGFLLVMLSTASMAGFGLSLEKEIEKADLSIKKLLPNLASIVMRNYKIM